MGQFKEAGEAARKALQHVPGFRASKDFKVGSGRVVLAGLGWSVFFVCGGFLSVR